MNAVENNGGRDLFGAQQQAVLAAEMQSKDPVKASKRHLTMHQDSSQLEDCLYPVRGIRDRQMRQGIKPVDFAQQNKQALHQQSAANRERRLSEASAALSAQQSRRSTPAVSRRTSGVATPLYSARSYRSRTRSDTGSASQREREERGPSGDLAVFGPPKPVAKHSNYGRVPGYLRERQLEMAEDQARQQAEKEASLVPKGMRILSDEERLQILEGLEASKREVEQQIQGLPLRVVTMSQKRHQQALESRLAELEEAITLFSKPKVLVENDPGQ